MTANPATLDYDDLANPEGRLRAIATLAHALADDWPIYRATEADLVAPTTAAARGSDSGPSSSVPDPTAGVVISYETYYEQLAEITEALGHLRTVQRRVNLVRKQHSSIAGAIESAVRNARCSGEMDPLCIKNAVRDGLCWGCYQRRRRHGASSS